MMQRVRQFFRALFAAMGEEDHAFVQGTLPTDALPLFYAMHVSDQVHALRTARTALALAEDAVGRAVDRDLLLRAALLHDVGRRKGDLNIWGKVFAVLAMKFAPRCAALLMQAGREQFYYPLGRMLYISHHHAEIGAEKLRKIGLLAEAAIVARHHLPAAPDDAAELAFLRMADARN